MSSEAETGDEKLVEVESTRFGTFSVPEESIIDFPGGLVGFSRNQRFVMLDHKPPFSWLHSVDDPHLAFVVVDGLEFGDNYALEPPVGNREIELNEDDEYAILVIVTVREDPKETTANLKAPLFVNLRNRKGVQVIFDNQKLSTRFPLWAEDGEGGESVEGEGEK